MKTRHTAVNSTTRASVRPFTPLMAGLAPVGGGAPGGGG